MICPNCKQSRTRKDWSDAQWWSKTCGDPTVQVGGYWRNCCRKCSQVEGWYYNDALDVGGSSNLELIRIEAASIQWLKDNVPTAFWGLMKTHYERLWTEPEDEERFRQRQLRLKRYCVEEGLSPNKSLLKLISHLGACRIDEETFPSLVPSGSRYPKSDSLYIDVTNKVYAYVLKSAWPEVSTVTDGASNDVTLGDYMEALLGTYYLRTAVWGVRPTEQQQTMILHIEKACLARYLIVHL